MTEILTRDDVLNMNPDKLPVICLSDGQGLISWRIRANTGVNHKDGRYSHMFAMHKSGMCASQDIPRFKEKSIDEYLSGRYRVKFWRNMYWTPLQRRAILNKIQATVDKRPLYDFLGIVGFKLHLRWLSIPGLDVCSEKYNKIFLDCGLDYDMNNKSPAEWNRYFKSASGRSAGWRCDGVYDEDLLNN